MKNSGDKIIQQQVDNIQVSFDKEAAWMRLQDRLESKDENKGNFRLGWVAAAVLLIASLLWFILQGERAQPMVKEVTKEATMPVAKEQEPVQEDIVKIQEEHKNISAVPQKKKIRSITPVKENLPVVKDQIPEPVLVQEEIAPIQETPKVAAAPKPKMKVVHINDVMQEQRIEERMNQSRYAGERNFLTPRQQYPQGTYQFNSQNKKAALSELEEQYRLLQN